MFKVCGSLDLSMDDLKKCIEGSQLLSSALTYERAQKGKCPVYVDESYFVRYAINNALDNLSENSKKFYEN